MATSETYTITMQAQTLIKSSLRAINAIDPGQAPGADELKDAREALNLIIFQLAGPPNFLLPGEKMWTNERVSITPANSISYDMKPGATVDVQVPIEIIDVQLKHTSSGSQTQLEKMTINEYRGLGNLDNRGVPQQWYYERRVASGSTAAVGKLYTNVPASSDVVSGYTLECLYRQPLEILSANTNDFEIYPEYYRALKWTLAKEIAPEWGRAVTPDIANNAREAITIAQAFHPEEAPEDAYFQPGLD